MEVLIQIDEKQLSQSIGDMINNLSPEKKEELCSRALEAVIQREINELKNAPWGQSEVRSLLKNFKETMIEIILSNEDMQKEMQKTVDEIRTNLPEIGQQAITILLAKMLSESLRAVYNNEELTSMNSMNINRIMNVLNIR